MMQVVLARVIGLARLWLISRTFGFDKAKLCPV